jgi:hypothetical protein
MRPQLGLLLGGGVGTDGADQRRPDCERTNGKTGFSLISCFVGRARVRKEPHLKKGGPELGLF